MTGTQITIKVHANYVQTCVRVFRETSLSYTEYCMFGASVPQKVLTCTNEAELASLLADAPDETYDVTAPYFPDFGGWLEIRFMFTDVADLSDFEVEEARYVDAKRGGRSFRGAFQDPRFKRPILLNILNAVAEKDATKLATIVNALDAAGI